MLLAKLGGSSSRATSRSSSVHVYDPVATQPFPFDVPSTPGQMPFVTALAEPQPASGFDFVCAAQTSTASAILSAPARTAVSLAFVCAPLYVTNVTEAKIA